jgi:hypothetical protein
VAERERNERHSAKNDEWQVRLRGAALETKRRLRPAGRGVRALLGRVAPPISAGLVALLGLLAAGLSRLLEGITAVVAWLYPRLHSLASSFAALVMRRVTPVATVAFVALVAAVALGVSQFLDYRGVAVGAENYEGEVGTVAPAPFTDVEVTGAAHLYLLLPVAVAAIVLTVAIALGRWQLSRYLIGLGLLTVVVSLAIDLPTGLDTGRDAYASSDVELLEGFWIQLLTGLVIALCGFLLGRYGREEAEPPARTADRSSWQPPGFKREKRREPTGPSGPPPPRELGA